MIRPSPASTPAGADLLEAVAQPTRRRILRLVWDEELPAGEIAAAFDVTFAAVSQHLKVLRDASAVSVRREGRRRYYRARHDTLGPLAAYLEAVWRSRLDDLKALAEAEEADLADSEPPTRGDP